MWCLRCYEPVRQLTPRDPGGPTITFLRDPNEGAERSRWKAGVNTFGPIGRIVVTALVLAVAPWNTNLVAIAVVWPCYLVLAALVLRQTWKRDHVVVTSLDEIGRKGRPASAPVAAVRTPIPRSTLVAYGLGALVAIACLAVWSATGEDVHAALTVCGAIGLFVVVVRWLMKP